METNKTDWVLNPKTNRFIKKGTALHNRLTKEGVINNSTSYKAPALVVEKKVKAVANVEDLTKSELDDVYDQIKMLREKRDAIIDRRLKGRPLGSMGNAAKPKVKEELKKSGVPSSKFKVKMVPSVKVSDTEYELGAESD